MKKCPYPMCTFAGTEAEVDDHRLYDHRDETQAGSNLDGPSGR